MRRSLSVRVLVLEENLYMQTYSHKIIISDECGTGRPARR